MRGRRLGQNPFDEFITGRSVPAREALCVFRGAGLFVTEWKGGLALNPLLPGDRAVMPALAPDFPVSRAVIEMFGRFEMSIEGRPIVWTRRRDRQIIAFLAGRPDGSATRGEILRTFWPEADAQLAGQSLRTACSTIRRAIGACVGQANVGRYFASDRLLGLILANTLISSRAFRAECDLAAVASERNQHADAFAHLRAAELLYRSPFLAGEPPERWALAEAAKFTHMHDGVVAGLKRLEKFRPVYGTGHESTQLFQNESA